MATTATNKQPLLIDRVFHNVVEGNTSVIWFRFITRHPWYKLIAVLVDCVANDGGIVEDLYSISRGTTTTTYKVLFYLSSSVDYLRPGEASMWVALNLATPAGTGVPMITA